MKSIRMRLITYFSILIAVALVGMSGVALYQASEAIENEAVSGMDRLAAESALTTTTRIEKQMVALEMIARRADMETMDWSTQRTILNNQMKRTEFLSFAVVDLEGNARFNDGAEANVVDRAYFKSALEGTTNVSDVVISRLTGNPEIVYATPIFNGSNVVGVLIARRDGYVLSDITDSLGYGATGYAYMINENGMVVAHNDRDRVKNQLNPIEQAESDPSLKDVATLFKKILDEKAGVHQYTYNDKKLIAAFQPVKGSHWTLVITADDSEVLASIPKMRTSLYLLTLGVLLISIVVVYFVGTNMAKPIIGIKNQAETIAGLDLSKDVPDKFKNRKDEIGSLAISLQSLVDSLRTIIVEIKNSAELVASSSEELTASSQQSATITEDVAKAIDEIAHGASNQAKSTEAGTEQGLVLGKSIEKDQEELVKLNHASDKVSRLVGEGLVEIEKLNSISDESGRASETVHKGILLTHASSQRIEAASQVIAAIADQTNLLALNAAIEAARAGEQGRGFAVVAEEIRKLAEQSTASTKTIDEVVKELQSNSNESVKVIEKVLEITKTQNISVRQTRDKYLEIAEAMKSAEKAVEGLNVSSKEMDVIKGEILDALQNLAAIAEENSAATQEVSASMEEQMSSIEDLATASEGLSELAVKLQNITLKFTT